MIFLLLSISPLKLTFPVTDNLVSLKVKLDSPESSSVPVAVITLKFELFDKVLVLEDSLKLRSVKNQKLPLHSTRIFSPIHFRVESVVDIDKEDVIASPELFFIFSFCSGIPKSSFAQKNVIDLELFTSEIKKLKNNPSLSSTNGNSIIKLLFVLFNNIVLPELDTFNFKSFTSLCSKKFLLFNFKKLLFIIIFPIFFLSKKKLNKR